MGRPRRLPIATVSDDFLLWCPDFDEFGSRQVFQFLFAVFPCAHCSYFCCPGSFQCVASLRLRDIGRVTMAEHSCVRLVEGVCLRWCMHLGPSSTEWTHVWISPGVTFVSCVAFGRFDLDFLFSRRSDFSVFVPLSLARFSDSHTRLERCMRLPLDVSQFNRPSLCIVQ